MPLEVGSRIPTNLKQSRGGNAYQFGFKQQVPSTTLLFDMHTDSIKHIITIHSCYLSSTRKRTFFLPIIKIFTKGGSGGLAYCQ